jgi:Spy/CpxP family protein refolding chaperone
MRTRSLIHVALPLSIAFATPACGGTAATEQVTSASSAVTRAPVAQNALGAVKLVGAALGDVPLTGAQRAEIEKLAADVDVRHAEGRVARKDMVLVVAAQVETGTIDRVALRPKIDTLVAAANASQPADRAAFDRLHAILGPDQRTAFVNALEARVRGHMENAHDQHPWKSWAQDLKLSDDQRAQIKAALEQHRHGGQPGRWLGEARERGAKVLDAFKQDRFSIDEVAPAKDLGQLAASKIDHFLGMVETLLPILTPEQRGIAAQKLRAHAAEGEPGAPLQY